MNIHGQEIERVYRHAHLFCGVGAGAKGFNAAQPRIGHIRARWECVGGIDVDAGAIRNFERLTGRKGTVMDLFARDQYIAFHGKEPPAGWREAVPADIIEALGWLVDCMFLSAPCKGFSGLLSSTQSLTDKYQALNALTLRGVYLMLEAYKDNPIPIVLFENVPRIANRGRWLLDQIIALFRGYGYAVSEGPHDCGELGGLAQSRKRYLLIARHMEKVPPFVYQPPKRRLRGVGEVIGRLPLPGDPVAGSMHRVPALQWQTWVRLAFVPAGKDWRALNDLAVQDGVLRDFGIMPDVELRDNCLGVVGWDERSPTIVGSQRSPLHGRHAVADPRIESPREGTGVYGVRGWQDPTGVVQGASRPANGAFSVADPRPGYGESTHRNVLGVKGWDDTANVVSGSPKPTGGAHAVADPRYNGARERSSTLGVRSWDQPIGVVAGETHPTNGAFSVADPRLENGHPKSVQLGVRAWGDTAACVKGDMSVGTGPYAVADPRMGGRPRFNNTFRIVRYDEPSAAVAGPGGPAGGHCVADPRAPASPGFKKNKYRVTSFDEATGSVIGASTTGDGAFAVADPRCTWGANSHRNKLRVTPDDKPTSTITGADRVGSGAPCVADSRREHYQTSGHYGVVAWDEAAGTVSASQGHDNGRGSVADPRDVELHVEPILLPQAKQQLVCRIVALDETWHRPFTTMELAALQSIVDPEEAFFQDETGRWHCRYDVDLVATSDATKREWIGNGVPSEAARAMAETIGETLILAQEGETFFLSPHEIWVKPGALALAVDSEQTCYAWERAA